MRKNGGKKSMTSKKFRHCNCGKRLKNTEVDICERCAELKEWKKKYSSMERQKSQCQTKNRELIQQVKKHDVTAKAKDSEYTHWLKVAGWEGRCSAEYLQKLLAVAKDHTHTICLSYGKR